MAAESTIAHVNYTCEFPNDNPTDHLTYRW